MELVSLDLESFGCVGRASINFKSGLNVLYGSNEIGKSSIAQAIRFALLLPSSSNEVESWIPWSGGGSPIVTLVFKHASDYYRVKKVFGTNTASLERSTDGNGWATLARGRGVDGQLRSLLQWGIPEPGGAKAPKGLPESFLVNALFSDQGEVASIFEMDLDADGVDSGRVHVRAALQALAQDPLLKSVLDTAQARVDEAFTPSGKPSWAASSPFKKMTDEVAKRQRERDEAEQVATAGRLLAQRVAELQRDSALAESDLEDKSAHRQALELKQARQIEVANATAAREAAQTLVAAVVEAENKVKVAEGVLLEFEPQVPDLRKVAEEARRTFEAATAVGLVTLERHNGELAHEEAAILREREALRVRQERVTLAADHRRADDLGREGKGVEQTLKTLDSEIAALEAVEPYTELQTARASLEVRVQLERSVSDLLRRAEDLRERAAMEWPNPSSTSLPGATHLANLRKLRHELEMAEAKLDVGLSVEVRGAPSVMVSIDDGAPETKVSPFAVEATKSTQLAIDGGIAIRVRAGRTADRDRAQRFGSDWREATLALFASVGVADLAALEELCRMDAERKARAEELTREAATIEAERTALGDPTGEKMRLLTRLKELERRLEGTDLALVEAAAAQGPKSRGVLARKTTERETQRTMLAKLRAQEDALRERVAANNEGEVIVHVDAEMMALGEAIQDLDWREKRLADERSVLDAPQIKNEALEQAMTKSAREFNEVVSKVDSATSDRVSWSARLQERQSTAAGIDLGSLAKAEEAARLAASKSGVDVDEAAIVNARNDEEDVKVRHEALVGELRKAEGALDTSGGSVADEHLRELEVAVQRAHEKQAALEDEYEAWKLLSDTLKEAERGQATHLGNLLAPDLSERLQALTGERYSGIALTPHLGLAGIHAAGGRRELEQLSIGTREQFSTLFRLCLAERLQSGLLLDDQLVQSDPDRLRWFRRALRRTAAAGVQVVVLTCRPDDYLEPAETPPPHVIELGTVITTHK